MIFPFNVYLCATVAACLTVLTAAPLWRQWCLRTGLVDEPGDRKIHDQPIPLAGGLAVITGLLLPALFACLALWWLKVDGAPDNPLPEFPAAERGSVALTDPVSVYLLHYGLGRRAIQLVTIVLGALGTVILGWLDDKRELRPAAKFTGQLAVAALVAAGGVRVTLFVPSLVFSYAITILWIVTVINAFNFMDNMNGLCAGLGAIGAWHFAWIAASENHYLVGAIAFLAFGALIGFLPYNFPRARAFLGDAGSHLVGYLLAVLAILPHFHTSLHPRPWAVLIPLLVLAVPLLDMVWVVLLRWRLGRPFYQGDTNHLSHRLVSRGLSRVQAVLVIWFAAHCIALLAWLL